MTTTVVPFRGLLKSLACFPPRRQSKSPLLSMVGLVTGVHQETVAELLLNDFWGFVIRGETALHLSSWNSHLCSLHLPGSNPALSMVCYEEMSHAGAMWRWPENRRRASGAHGWSQLCSLTVPTCSLQLCLCIRPKPEPPSLVTLKFLTYKGLR